MQERADHIAEWVMLTNTKMVHNEPFFSQAKVGAGRGNEGGARAAALASGVMAAILMAR